MKENEGAPQFQIKGLRGQSVNAVWTPAKNKQVAFIDEYMKMAKYEFDFEGILYNKIMSPGAKLFGLVL